MTKNKINVTEATMKPQGSAVSPVPLNSLVSFRTIPHVCCTCTHFDFDGGGGWDCKKDRANGDVGEGFQWLTKCNGWRMHSDFKN